ncbi:unnamed protein product [Mesocestoides corti]|uniref:Uncharacterized protein n=1 Tax=Mesocestoides corti TaxID=53468 RepID=A0A0R3UKI8_MESCO|nr:unnamed protein product [Mesocestoides corti]
MEASPRSPAPEQEVRIFKEIHDHYGKQVLQNVRRWEWAVIHEAVTREQLFFLHSCVRSDVFPKSVHYKPPIPTDRAKDLAYKLSVQMRKELITDAHHRLEKYAFEINKWRTICEGQMEPTWVERVKSAIQYTADAKRQMKKEYLNQKLQRLRSPRKENQENLIDRLSQMAISRNRRVLGDAGQLREDPRAAFNEHFDEKRDFPSFNAAFGFEFHDSGLFDDYL